MNFIPSSIRCLADSSFWQLKHRYEPLCYLAIACAMLARLPYLYWPLFSEPYREAQTAMTVWAFGQSSHISLLNYETPIFGPPWQVPMELPVFQVFAYLLKCLLHLNYDMACHLAGLSMFCLSAWLTKWLCEVLTGDSLISLLAVTFYIITPYAHRYSTACLIEYCAVSCCLAYVLSLSYLLTHPGRFLVVCSTIVLGILAYSVKSTSMAGYICVVLVMATASCLRSVKSIGVRATLKGAEIWKLALCLIVPLACGYAWVKYADQIKLQSAYTAKWSSSALATWNYGTIDQRLDLKNWCMIYSRLWRGIAPYAFVVILLLGVVSVTATRKKNRASLLALSAGLVIPVCIFFNLYIPHPYYFIALTPIAAILVAIGMGQIVKRSAHCGGIVKALGIALLAASLVLPYYLERRLYFTRGAPDYLVIGRYIDGVAPRDGKVFLVPHDYSGPAILYYAKRRGFFTHHQQNVGLYADHIQKCGYSHIVCADQLQLAEIGLPGYSFLTNCCGYNIYGSVP
jgi:hypothetical protein